MRKRNELIVAIIFIMSMVLFRVNMFNIFSISSNGGNKENLSFDKLTSELYKYNCNIIKESGINTLYNYYITDNNCIFNIEYIEFNFIEKMDYYNVYLDKVNDNGDSIKSNSLSISGLIVSKDTIGNSYKYMSMKNNSILYLNTALENEEEAKTIRKNLGYEYNLNINLKYLIIPVVLFILGIIGLIYISKSKKN